MKKQKSHYQKKELVTKNWILLDAENQILGRLATKAATILRGKTKPEFTPSVDMGDNVIIINAEKILVTGKKPQQKIYYRHSGYPGGLKETRYDTLFNKHPERIIQHAIEGMLPKNKLRARLMTHLKIYRGADHPHHAQQPTSTD